MIQKTKLAAFAAFIAAGALALNASAATKIAAATNLLTETVSLKFTVYSQGAPTTNRAGTITTKIDQSSFTAADLAKWFGDTNATSKTALIKTTVLINDTNGMVITNGERSYYFLKDTHGTTTWVTNITRFIETYTESDTVVASTADQVVTKIGTGTNATYYTNHVVAALTTMGNTYFDVYLNDNSGIEFGGVTTATLTADTVSGVTYLLLPWSTPNAEGDLYVDPTDPPIAGSASLSFRSISADPSGSPVP